MEKIKINESDSSLEQQYEKHIIKSIESFQKYKEFMKLTGKILHYLEKPVLHYICIIYWNTKINPFDFNIIFSFEFIEGEIPYISILTNFEPNLNDNRNYYRCLTKKYKYHFSLDNLIEQEKILENIINGLENFLALINESLAINTFIFFGQYEYDHIYQINDFLQKDFDINFIRINDLKEKEEKYIIITELYFLLFKPIEQDKSLVKLLFYQKLKDLNINLLFEKNEKNGNLILKLKDTKYKENIEFELINRKRKNKLNEINLVLNEHLDNNCEFLENLKSNNIGNNIDFKKYNMVIEKYKILFNGDKNNFKIKEKSEKKIKEYIKCVEFYEKLLELYDKLKIKKERRDKIIDNIIYLCSELVNYTNCEGEDDNKYLIKIRKYIELQKNK